MKAKYQRVKKFVLDRFPAFPARAYSEQAYTWAHAILDSRAIWWNGQRHLVPMLDFVNCGEGPNPQRVHSTFLDAAYGSDAVTLADRDFPQGSHVLENYGQPNGIYFLYHGFTLGAANHHDCVSHRVKLTQAQRIQLNAKGFSQAAVQAQGGLLLCIRAPASHPKNKEMQRVLEVTDTSLLDVVKRRIEDYPTTLEQDDELLRGGTLGSRRELIVRFRLGEKRILHALEKELLLRAGDARNEEL